MKRTGLFFGVFFLFLCGFLTLGNAADNSAIGEDITTTKLKRTDTRYHIRFSTTIVANTATLIVGTSTANNFFVPPSINISTGGASFGYTSSTSVTMGGRYYISFQFVRGLSNLHYDYYSVDLSTNTSKWLSQGQTYPPVFQPIVWQGPFYVRSDSTGTITGDIYFDKVR